MRLFFLAAILASGMAASAQWRIQIQSGPAIPLKPQSKDSLFFAKEGLHVQAKATYYLGHLGFTLAAVINKHNQYKEAGIGQPPTFDSLAKTFSGSGWTGSFITFGPEFCFPYKKIKFQAGMRGGMAIQSANPTRLHAAINGQNIAIYTNELRKKLAFAWQAEAGAILYSNAHLGYGITANLSGTSIQVSNQDRRFNSNSIRTLKSKYTALSLAVSIAYKL